MLYHHTSLFVTLHTSESCGLMQYHWPVVMPAPAVLLIGIRREFCEVQGAAVVFIMVLCKDEKFWFRVYEIILPSVKFMKIIEMDVPHVKHESFNQPE